MSVNKTKYLSVIYNDFMISLLATRQNDLAKGITYQIALEDGIIKNGLIEDEDALFYILKEHFKKLKIKNHTVRFVAPSQNVLMKKIAIPETYTTTDEVKSYVDDEVQQTIHLPFDEPQIDVFTDEVEKGKALLFATEKDELMTLTHLFEDLGQYPEVIDVKAFADLRIIEQVLPDFNESTNLILDWSIDELRLTIVEKGQVELLKAIRIKTNREDWTVENDEDGIVNLSLTANKGLYENEIGNTLSEIDKAVHFYQFSLNKGSKEIQRVLMLGDHPMLNDITEIIKAEVPLTVEQITDEAIDAKFPTYYVKHSTLLGLTMKGVSHE